MDQIAAAKLFVTTIGWRPTTVIPTLVGAVRTSVVAQGLHRERIKPVKQTRVGTMKNRGLGCPNGTESPTKGLLQRVALPEPTV
jgi:hypothetical protein